MDFKSTRSDWIWAVKDGSPMQDDSQSVEIDVHDAKSEFTLDLTKARGGSSLNPFVVATPSGTSIPAVPSGTGNSANGGGDARRQATIAHGTIMSLAFVIINPIGAIMIRLLKFRSLVLVHAGTQLFSYTLALAGLGLGVFIAVKPSYRVCTFTRGGKRQS